MRKFMLAMLCALICAGAAAQQPVIKNEAEAKAYCMELFKLFQEKNGAKCVALMPTDLQKSFNIQMFNQSCAILSRIGDLASATFLTRLRNPNQLNLLWKVEYRRTDLQGNTVIQDGLLSASFKRAGDSFELIGYRFF